jgi:hypothetical protein
MLLQIKPNLPGKSLEKREISIDSTKIELMEKKLLSLKISSVWRIFMKIMRRKLKKYRKNIYMQLKKKLFLSLKRTKCKKELLKFKNKLKTMKKKYKSK